MLDEPIAQIVNDLFELFAARQVNYVLVGGIAMLSYVEGRNTEDIDLILSLPDLKRLDELTVESQDSNFARAQYRGLQIDVLLTQNKLFDLVRREYATQGQFGERALAVAKPEGLILLKFYALPSLYRQGDFTRVALYETDLVMLLRQYSISAETILTVLKPHLSDTDLQSLREIYDEVMERIMRYSTGRE